MTTDIPNYRRLLPRRVWMQRGGVLLAVWSCVAALALAASLVVLFLIADLIVYQGQIQVPVADSDLLKPFVTTVDATGQAEDTGIRATLWRYRNFPVPNCPVASRLHTPLSRFIPLRTNRGALATLVVTLVGLGILHAFSVNRIRSRSAGLAQEVATSLRSQIHRQILRLGPGDLDQRDYSSAQSLFVKSVDAISGALTSLLSTGISHWAGIALVLGVMLVIDWSITLQALFPLLAGFALIRWERTQGVQRQQLAEAHAAGDLRVLSEGLRKSRIVRGFGMESVEQERFQKYLDRYSGIVRSGAIAQGWSLWAARVIGALLLAIVLFLVGSRVLGAGKPLGIPSALTIIAGFVILLPLVNGITSVSSLRRTIGIEWSAIQRFLSVLPEVGQAVGAKFIDPVTKRIQFEGVTYRRGDKVLLNNFDLLIPAGSVTALVSLDPLESRAAAAMIPRFLEPQSGRVLFDGEDIGWGTLESIRAETIYVGGNDPCFTGTVSENIRCGDPRYDSPAVMEAAKLVHAHQFIQRLPLGYETQLGEHGEQLTPGQTFLLGLARAIIRNPAVIIIDEPTEALDQGTKNFLDDTYQRMADQRTVVFIPTRLSTVRRCDRVVVIDEGRVDSIGPQPELVKSSELYRHWEYVMFNVFRRNGEKG
ncbi:MAG: ABC transporter ATP-binding protein [Planctomycetaceae bacterium]